MTKTNATAKRAPKPRVALPDAAPPAPNETPVDYMLRVMRDPKAEQLTALEAWLKDEASVAPQREE